MNRKLFCLNNDLMLIAKKTNRNGCLKKKSVRSQDGKKYPKFLGTTLVGMTGYTCFPHLHFHVFVFTGYNIWTDFDTLEVNCKFELNVLEIILPTKGMTYKKYVSQVSLRRGL